MTDQQRELQLRILAAHVPALEPAARILDFGCGDGAMVDAYRRAGFDAYGCDIVVSRQSDRVRAITEPYRLPFDDSSFDVVISDQVLEHVRDHEIAAREIARVCRPHGTTLHLFPGRWRIIEAHVNIPFAGALQHRAWLALWALLGIRNPFQRGLSVTETVARNEAFLHESTNYVPARTVARSFEEHFGVVRFVERDLLRCTQGRSRRLAPLIVIPGVAAVYGTFFMRALLTARPRHAT